MSRWPCNSTPPVMFMKSRSPPTPPPRPHPPPQPHTNAPLSPPFSTHQGFISFLTDRERHVSTAKSRKGSCQRRKREPVQPWFQISKHNIHAKSSSSLPTMLIWHVIHARRDIFSPFTKFPNPPGCPLLLLLLLLLLPPPSSFGAQLIRLWGEAVRG